jgi:GABA permease
MISLGGIIGAGLFVGSSALISTTELALSSSRTLVFSEYTREPLGAWAAFLSGWLYAYFWIVVIAVETLAGAATLQRWISLPMPILGFLLLGILTVTNLTAVRTFGEMEFWFASIKVLAIVVFIAIALWFVYGARLDCASVQP